MPSVRPQRATDGRDQLVKHVKRGLAAIASLALTAALGAVGASPVAAASPKPPAPAPGIEYTAKPGDGPLRSSNGKGTAEMPISPDNPAGTEWLNDCLGSSDAQDPDGRVHNRFKWCQEYEFKNRYYKKVDGKPVLKGTNTIRFQAAAIGYNDTRATRVFFRAKTGQVSYDGWNSLEKRTVAPNLKLEITPECVPGANRPTTATCGVGRSPAKMEWAQWSNFPDWVYWDVSSVGGEGQDQVARHQWRLYLNGASPGYEQSTERGEGPPIGIRCDSADYFTHGVKRYPHACIYTGALPFLTYDGNHPNIRQHIRDAQNAPATDGVTYPKENHPKKVPGKWSPTAGSRGAPLHRVGSRGQGGAIALANEEVKKAACGQKSGSNPWGPDYNAATGLPPYNTSVDDCDEYPFSSTYEGASSIEWDFSVRNIAMGENRSAGTKLSNFYVDDRILAWPVEDPYWVNVD
ncbi:NucA/NucB deoxyribonuclease domain-containing protein [Streptomyces sp. fd1-xmd]|uniref:NucA/NucB deoxyribonuclease domain-containing protein n=1 Tax=Streptomyces sp. fd1-xmd TaxID=1812480 RepID=UPI0009907E22|nr:NucA/NucB deoxyribonuclease domain-containing protein [Streptomyces sp. fd1-xmd]